MSHDITVHLMTEMGKGMEVHSLHLLKKKKAALKCRIVMYVCMDG